jgi:RNA polymerase sigma-70 factor (ECF subfamily)
VDPRAREIEELYGRRYLAFRNTLATVTGSYESARDVVQEAFAQALRKRRQFRGDGSLEAWVWRIAFRLALGERGGNRTVSLDLVAEPALVEPERDPELAAAVRALPPRRRLVVFLRYFADLSYAEIAEVCGINEGTVAATLAQARATLLAALEKERALP